ncbi:hypothetical protein Tco_0014601 [Tanacetum coccineum]
MYKFSDGTLTRLLSSLEDIAKNIDMEYLPKRRWCNLEKKRAHFMIKDINKLLKERRMMRSLEKFVGDSVEVLRYDTKGEKVRIKGIVPTEMELVLEQTQQGTSYEVSVDPYGFEGIFKDGDGEYMYYLISQSNDKELEIKSGRMNTFRERNEERILAYVKMMK